MISKRRLGIILLILILALGMTGCSNKMSGMLQPTQDNSQLIKVRIHFGSGDAVDAYVRELGIESTGKVYAGGSSSTPLYDAQGNIIGTCNYQRVLYMQVLTDEAPE